MKGYINSNFKFLKINNKKYYNTGDLVKKEKGQLYWLSRNDSMIKQKGIRIYTSEIDEVVDNKNKGIISKTILLNDKLILFYVGNILQKNILLSVEKYLPNYMRPSKIIRIKHFPLGSTGKVDINKLKEIYEIKQN
jgi:acyl-coenzyme A synthetase/AMP-(fatty) acid ligase